MNWIYFGFIVVVLSITMGIQETSAEDGDEDDMPDELKKLLEKNSTLGDSLVKLIVMGKDFSADIWKQPVTKTISYRQKLRPQTHTTNSIKHYLNLARKITKETRNSSETMQKSMRWIDVALDDVNKVIDRIMAIQTKVEKIEEILYELSSVEYHLPEEWAEGRIYAVQVIDYDIDVGMYLYNQGRDYITFKWFKDILEKLLQYSTQWLDLYYPRRGSVKGRMRWLVNEIIRLRRFRARFYKSYVPDVDALAETLGTKIETLDKVTRKKLKRAREEK